MDRLQLPGLSVAVVCDGETILARGYGLAQPERAVPAAEQMWTPARLNDGREVEYGLGWELRNVDGHTLVGHGGGRAGVTTRFMRDLESRLTAIVLVPVSGIEASRLAREILEAVRRSSGRG